MANASQSINLESDTADLGTFTVEGDGAKKLVNRFMTNNDYDESAPTMALNVLNDRSRL